MRVIPDRKGAIGGRKRGFAVLLSTSRIKMKLERQGYRLALYTLLLLLTADSMLHCI